jgi:hypothetical protein
VCFCVWDQSAKRDQGETHMRNVPLDVVDSHNLADKALLVSLGVILCAVDEEDLLRGKFEGTRRYGLDEHENRARPSHVADCTRERSKESVRGWNQHANKDISSASRVRASDFWCLDWLAVRL